MARKGMHLTKRGWILWAVFLCLSIALLFWFNRKNQERRDYIERTGIETVGTITRKASGRSGRHGGSTFSCHFRFEHNGETFSSHSSLTREQYNSVEVGDRFVVFFLPCRPQRDAIIFLDRPVID